MYFSAGSNSFNDLCFFPGGELFLMVLKCNFIAIFFNWLAALVALGRARRWNTTCKTDRQKMCQMCVGFPFNYSDP